MTTVLSTTTGGIEACDILNGMFNWHYGASAPTTTWPYQNWADTGSTPKLWKQRNEADNDWIVRGLLDQPYFGLRDGRKNYIINGNFDIWQRGTSLTAGTGERYLLDRWVTTSIGSTIAPSRQSFVLGQTEVSNEPLYFHRFVIVSSAGAANKANTQQRIESVRSLAGKNCSLSFYAKADAAKPISVEFNQNFGTGGSPSATVTTIGVNKVNLTSSWQKFTIQNVSIPSISGKTLGTANNDFLQLTFWFDAGSDFNARTNSLGQQSGTFDIAQVQLEEGPICTNFEYRSRQQELAMCHRYAWKINAPTGWEIFSQGWGLTITTAGFLIPYPVEMRAAPTPTYGGNIAVSLTTGLIAVTALSALNNIKQIGQLQATVAAGLTANTIYRLQANNDATAYLLFDAEL